jgi:hypothetical protein
LKLFGSVSHEQEKDMRKLHFFVFLLICTLSVFAQNTGGGGEANPDLKQPQALKPGKYEIQLVFSGDRSVTRWECRAAAKYRRRI